MDFSPASKMCSFCGIHGTRKTKFAGGLGAMMCADCLEYYHGVLSSKKRTAAISRPPWESMSDTELLSKLPLIAQTADQVNEFLVDWVRLARSRNLSWAEIGKALGTSRQAAWERFAEVRADDQIATA
ncbi:hypothetical protein [Nocardioides sp.]|uniref:hypothetical protein n=1 Tax=Nocardioides sp. TaxID=35761 RepID=UPI0031FE82FB|nr:Clp protease ClpX [Nocardioides sp.]